MRFRNFLWVAMGLLLKGCFWKNKQIVYSFENDKGVYKFTTTNPDTAINKEVNFWTMEIETGKGDAISINFIYSEAPPNAEKLLSISTNLYAPDGANGFKKLKSKSELEVDYWDGKDRIKINKTNNDVPLNKLVDWEKVSYTYEFMNVKYIKKDNPVTFRYSIDFETDEYPDTLKLFVDFVWENGTRKYETVLTKEEYKGRKINPKF